MSYLSVHTHLVAGLLGRSTASKVINIAVLLFLIYLASVFVVVPIARVVLDILDFKRLPKRSKVFLEITPPGSNSKSPGSTAQLFTAIYSIVSSRSRLDLFLRRKKIISFEVVATRNEGIRYIVQLNEHDVSLFERSIVSYLPQTKFRRVNDYLIKYRDSDQQITEFKQAGHFAYPLASHDNLYEHDPIAYITGSMKKPAVNELIAYQLVMSAASRRKATKVRSKLLSGKDAGLNRGFWQLLFSIISKLLYAFMGIISFIFNTLTGDYSLDSSHKASNRLDLSPGNKEILDSLHTKLSQPLFNVDIRVLVASDNDSRMQGMINALSMFHVPDYQGLVMRSSFPRKYKLPYRARLFVERSPSMFTANSSILAASELALLYHFPYGEHGSDEDIASSLSRTLPAPVGVKADADNAGFDVILGKNIHHGSETLFGLTANERERHAYIIGGTGNGKTTMLQYAIVQDIKAGKGVAVIDPHGDLAATLLRYIPKDRVKDVIYFNPRDISHPIGLNLLEIPEGLDENELLIEQDFITESIVSVFRKIFSDDDSGGHRIEHFLRSAIHTAFTVPEATLFTVYKLLTNTKYRNTVVSKLDDEDLIDFWKSEFNSAGDYQKVKMSSGVNAKLGRFRRSAVTRRILEQPKSTINFDDIIQNNKILICNFSKGQIGEDTSALLGTSVLAKLQLAALRRSRLDRSERSPFYLYVDEFQNLATSSFAQVLSEARKYKLFLTIAEQTTAQQQDKRLTEVILANVGTVICFRTGSIVDERLLQPLFSPFIKENEISNLPAYSFYARLMAVKAQKPLSGETMLLDDLGDEKIAERVVKESRKQYAVEYKAQAPESVSQPEAKVIEAQEEVAVASAVTPIEP